MTRRKKSQNRAVSSIPKRGFSVKPGTNPVAYGLGTYATPEAAARHADDHWEIVDNATGLPVGKASDFR